MRQVWVVFAIFSMIFFFTGCHQKPAVLHDTEDHVVIVKGKWVILHYWAAWCERCVDELPEWNHFYEQHKNVAVYGVNYETLPKQKLRELIQTLHIRFPVLLEDPRAVLILPTVSVIPTTFVIDPHGKVVRTILGPITASTQSPIP